MVKERDSISVPFNCQADAFPVANYFWQFASGNRTSEGPELTFRKPIKRQQNGTYICTAYNDLGSQKAVVELTVIYPPQCQLRKQIDSEGRLHLRCLVDAFPANVSYHWRRNEEPLTTAMGSSLHFRQAAINGQYEDEGIVGTFSCEAKNIAGLGERCAITVNGPVAALVAETDYTYLMFGGGSVVVVLVLIVVSIVACRRHSTAKYNTSTTATGPRRLQTKG